MTELKTNEFKCAVCKGIFEKGLTDEEAEQQLNEEFPGFDKEECGLVCDDCYKEMFPNGT